MSKPVTPPILGAYLATFVDDPLVNDIRREFWGKPAIKAWAEREIFGDNVAMEVLRAVEHYGDVILSAKFDGTYDKTNLPDPLILTLYFTMQDGLITQLIILRNKTPV